MKLSIKDGVFYVDNVFLCYCEAGHGRDYLQPGIFEVSTQFSHAHGEVLPNASDFGWIGASDECDCILGSVHSKHGLIPSSCFVGRLLSILEECERFGKTVWLEVT